MIALLYLLCSVLLLITAALAVIRSPRSALHWQFALTALALLAWVLTLFLFNHTATADIVFLGRLNFAAALFAVTLGWLFVRTMAGKVTPHLSYLLTETVLLALLTAFTPLVDRDELPGMGPGGRPLTLYGPLFPLYLLHIVAYLSAAVSTAFRSARVLRGPVRDQLLLVGSGTLGTGLVALVTNAVLPYGFGDFRFTDIGTISTIAFLLCIGYAVLKHRLFDLKLFVRKSLVWGLLLSFALSAYSAVVVLVTERVAGEQAGTLTRVAILMIAFSFDPLRRSLEKRIDSYLFRERATLPRRR